MKSTDIYLAIQNTLIQGNVSSEISNYIEFQGTVRSSAGVLWNVEGCVETFNNELSYSLVFFNDSVELDGMIGTIKIDKDITSHIQDLLTPDFVYAE